MPKGGIDRATVLALEAMGLAVFVIASDVTALYSSVTTGGVTALDESVVAQVPADVADHLLEIVRDAFVAGMQWGFRVDTALAFLGLLVSAFLAGGSVHLRQRRVGLLDSSDRLS